MRQREDLRPYQGGAVEFIKTKKRCGLFVDPGLGKTVSTLTAFVELIDDMECGMTLIVAPPRVAKKTWPDEFKEWAHTNDKSFVHIKGSLVARRKLLKRRACFHIISIELLPWLLKELGGHAPDARKIKALLEKGDQESIRAAKKENKWLPPTTMPYDAIVIDESSKVKNYKTSRWRSLRLMAFRVEYFVILTGTPAANGIIDLWAQIYLLDGGERLGHNISAFRERWFNENYSGHGYTPKDWAIKVIEDRIADIVFTLREEDYADLPPRMYNTITLPLDDETRKRYKKFEATLILQSLDGSKDISADKGAALTGKLLQLANGIVYDEDKGEHLFHKVKLDALEDLVDELGGQPVLVSYQFKSDAKRIMAKFKNAVMFTDDPSVQDRWNAGQIAMLLVHPQSAAHGLNLQHGGNNVVWYGPTWSLENYIQLNKRLHRSGQKKTVMIHHLVVEDSMDENVMKSLAEKNTTQESLLNALKERIQMYTRL